MQQSNRCLKVGVYPVKKLLVENISKLACFIVSSVVGCRSVSTRLLFVGLENGDE